MAGVTLEHVSKLFNDRNRGEVVAVRDATFDVKDGEFVVFLGPSGCGKTTSLRMIAGLENQSSGDIFIGDRLVNRLPARSRDIAMVFQDYALYPHMSVRDNLSFGLRNLHVPSGQIDREVNRVAEMLEIDALLNRKPRELSGGQRQRVALGRAIVRAPQVFLFDEPLSNLDAKLRVQMRVELLELHVKLRTTTVYVTHDQIEAMTLGQRIVVMNHGVIQQIDPPARIYDHPNNMFVAQFIGAPPMNLAFGRLESPNAFVGDGFTIRLSPAFAAQHDRWSGRELYLGIRPEDIQSARPGETPDVQAAAKVMEYLGSEVIAYFGLGKETWTARMAPDAIIQPQQRLDLACDFKRAAFFDPETQQRITV
ncbi:MAG TPA: sn-glycerol-3-phosphate ABC transporter ATP-binding protein UgpC [Chloroflexota bacterium]|nr:sn-glycerol-3-phosphate ABC transporter ATP-binding protein UgpC [Chloroflexota bacterium]